MTRQTFVLCCAAIASVFAAHGFGATFEPRVPRPEPRLPVFESRPSTSSGRPEPVEGRTPNPESRQAKPQDWSLVVLGIAQDAGMPHLRCLKPPCADVRAGKRAPEKVSSLGLVNGAGDRAFIFDATPDFPAQVHALTGGRAPDGVFLTHAHIGHYTGLMYLGKESIAADAVPVFCTRRMADFLTINGPWSLLVKDRHIDLRVMDPDRAIEPAPGVRVTAFTVPHRDEYTDTVGFLIQGPRKKAVFIPDIDRWEKWGRSIRELADRVDLAFLDGTFSSSADLGLRSLEAIPHPMMPATRELLGGTRAALWFIHLNHTNPELLTGRDVVREGMKFPI